MPAAVPPPRVLVVDDDEVLLILLAEALREAGLEVATAQSGRAALAAVAAGAPDLLVLDLKLADVGWREMLRRLREHDPVPPFIVVTGQGDERVAVEVMKQGALDYVAKNAALLDLLPDVVRRALRTVERDRDGAYRWILCRGVLERDPEGRPRRFTAAHADVTERKRLEQEMLRISDREQWRIGQDLHDGLGQQLTATQLLTDGLRADLEERMPALAPQARRISDLLRESIATTRSLAHGLTPFKLDAQGLGAALAELAARSNGLGRGVRCRFEGPTEPVSGDAESAGHLYRIAQEAVGNALRHAGAKEIRIRLAHDAGVLRLEVADDGRGLRLRRGAAAGIGLDVMRHRATTIGAELNLASKPGKGVTVTCILRRPA